MTQAAPIALTRPAPEPAAGWLTQAGTAALLAGVGLLIFPPLIYLASSAIQAGTLGALSIGLLAGLAATTLSLATLATLWAMLLALPLAWLVVRTDMPFRNACQWLAVIPLAIPSYIGAMAYIALLGPVGSFNAWLSALTGSHQQWVNIYGFWGGVFVLGLFTYPYIFLLVGAALEATNPSIEETARSLGESPLGVLRRVTLPMLRPSILAGGLLVFLYALSDFGSLSLLRVQVFTTAIYHQLNTRFDQAAAALLSFVLVLITLAVLVGQRALLSRRSYVTITGTARIARPVRLGRWRWPAASLAGGILSLSVFLPVGVLIAQTGTARQFLDVLGEQWEFVKNSLAVAGAAATLAMIVGFLIAINARRAKGNTGSALSGTIQMGYAIPGTVLGLSLILLYNTYLPWLYGTVGVLVLAYLIRFLTQSVQGIDAALAGINPHLEEAARSLAASPGAVLRRVLAPLVRPTLFAVWTLVFISAMKELDATLLLRPAGFDTLPVRVYIHTVEAEYGKAGTLALLLIAFTALPWLLVTRLREKKLV
jgi:iron(III) transport system permease protein